jgi:hypothetical protein
MNCIQKKRSSNMTYVQGFSCLVVGVVLAVQRVSAFRLSSNVGRSIPRQQRPWGSAVDERMPPPSSSLLATTTTAPNVVEKIAGSDKLGLLDKSNTMRAERGTTVRLDAKDKLKVGIIGAGLAGMVTAMDLADAGHDIQIFESRPFVGGKVSSWKDPDGNHIEMGLHVFFGCYYNLFGIMRRLGIYETSLRLKEHTHTFINKGGVVGELDFRLGGIGAPINGLAAFARTTQLSILSKLSNAIALATSPVVKALLDFDGAMEDIRALDNVSFTDWWFSKGGNRDSLNRMWDPIAYALGFIDCDNISARCMLTIFNLFAVRSEASILRMCEGSPNTYLHEPIVSYLQDRGATFHLNTRIRDITHEVDTDGKPTLVKVGFHPYSFPFIYIYTYVTPPFLICFALSCFFLVVPPIVFFIIFLISISSRLYTRTKTEPKQHKTLILLLPHVTCQGSKSYFQRVSASTNSSITFTHWMQYRLLRYSFVLMDGSRN